MANTQVKKIVKRIFLVLVGIFGIIQFFHPAKNVAAASTDKDIARMYTVPDSVYVILDKACYDCHSNNTRYPWYFNIQPVAWWMDDHIGDGKRELNFSDFGSRTPAKQAKKLKKLAKEVEEGGMPLDSYTWIHKDAVLTEREKRIIIQWADSLSVKIAAQAPPATN